MKHPYIKLIGIMIAMATFISCEKFVDYNPKDDFLITDQDYLKTESDYRTMLVSVYTPLQWINQAVPVSEVASDNAVAGGENASDVLGLQQIDEFTHTSTNPYLKDIWVSCYEGINRANYMHQYKNLNAAGVAVNFGDKNALYGEVYFLRAYYYFTLVKFFGGVPLFTEKRLTLTDSRSIPRSTKEEVYQQIEADLTEAISSLSTSAYQPGRITKYAAQALLGKVYMYQNKFDQAAPLLESIINAKAFTLVPKVQDIFLLSGENGPESVFEIQYSNKSPYYNWGGTTRGQGNLHVQQVGIRGLSGSADMPFAPGWSTTLPTQDLAKAYLPGDQRKDATILDIEAYKAANPQYNIVYQVAPYKNTGLYSMKYQPRKGQTSGQLELNYLNNYRIIRYAEVLLLAAEALNRKSAPNDSQARVYLNEVRARAFGNSSQNITAAGEALKLAIWNERRLELAMEGDRFFDLVRTGQAASVLTGLFSAGKHELFPIPQDEVNISGLDQNPRY